MTSPTIRPARADEHNEVARVWMNSWVSTGLAEASEFLLANLRARVSHEIEQGWSLFVADDRGTLAAMLALHLPKRYLDQLFVAPEYQGKGLGKRLLAFTRENLPNEIWLRCVRENERAWRVPAADILANNCNLDIKNPRAKQDLEHLPPEELVESILQKEQRIAELLAEVRDSLRTPVEA